jgi:UDPglucose 6-dehydrogenase
MTKVAILGYGWVGKAMKQMFPDAYLYDPALGYGQKDEVNQVDVAFICVPTPNLNGKEGELDTSIVEDCAKWCTCPLLVIRSTVNPGTTDMLAKKYNRNIVMQPEYLGETPAHPMLDQKTRQFIIIGGEEAPRRALIELYTNVYNANTKITQVTAYEAEVIKLSENRAISFKVAQCQELYDVCERAGIDYYKIQQAVYGDDPRFNLWWTLIYPQKRGMLSKCIPKDVYAWSAWAESLGYKPIITRSILSKNKEWIASQL